MLPVLELIVVSTLNAMQRVNKKMKNKSHRKYPVRVANVRNVLRHQRDGCFACTISLVGGERRYFHLCATHNQLRSNIMFWRWQRAHSVTFYILFDRFLYSLIHLDDSHLEFFFSFFSDSHFFLPLRTAHVRFVFCFYPSLRWRRCAFSPSKSQV